MRLLAVGLLMSMLAPTLARGQEPNSVARLLRLYLQQRGIMFQQQVTLTACDDTVRAALATEDAQVLLREGLVMGVRLDAPCMRGLVFPIEGGAIVLQVQAFAADSLKATIKARIRKGIYSWFETVELRTSSSAKLWWVASIQTSGFAREESRRPRDDDIR